MPQRPRLVLALAALPVVWGLAFVAIKESLAELSPAALTLLRFAIADVLLLVLILVLPAARPRFERGDVWRLVVLGVTGVPMYHLALNWGEQRTSASVASLVVATAPAMVAVGSALVLRTPLTWRRIGGIALAFGGVALLATATGGEDGTDTQLVGFLVALLAPVSWAIYTIVGKPLTERADALRVTVTTILIGSVTLVPFAGGSTFDEIGRASAATWAWVAYLGAGATVVGYLLFVWALKATDPTRVSMSLYAVPIVGVLSARVLLDEPLGWVVPVAAALVIGGVALVQRDSRRIVPIADEPVPVDERA